MKEAKQSSIQILPDTIVDPIQLANWAIARLNEPEISSPADISPFRAFGVVKTMPDGTVKPICVVLYNFFRQLNHGNDMRVIIASDDPSWCLPGVLRELFRYPYEIAGCERLTAFIRDGNKRSLKLCQGLGFKKEGTLRRAHDGKTNAIVLSMLKHECKWLHDRTKAHKERETDGQEVTAFSASSARSGSNGKRSSGRKQGSPAPKREVERGGRLRPNGVSDVRA